MHACREAVLLAHFIERGLSESILYVVLRSI